jgi:hypothetical protein
MGEAILYALDKGAFVMNVSFNGFAGGIIRDRQRAAMDQVRAQNALVVQSVSNWKSDEYAGSITENLVGADLANKDWFLYGIGVTPDLKPAISSAAPGPLADRTLAVVAWGAPVTDQHGNVVIDSGNSFAPPAIAGAAALLKQYWPQLGGKEISSILLDTAIDIGDPGVDQIYGKGLLNIEGAFKASAPTLGTTSWSSAPVAATSVVFSPAFGGQAASERFSAAAGKAVALDKYGRDYEVNVGALAGGMRSRGVSLASLVQDPIAQVQAPAVGGAAAFGYTSAVDGYVRSAQAGHFGFRLSKNVALAGSVNGSIDSTDMMTGSMLHSAGVATRGSKFDLFLSGNKLSLASARNSDRGVSSSTQRFGVQAENGLSVNFTNNREEGAALGMRGTGAFDIIGSTSNFATLGWSGDIGAFGFTCEAMIGSTKVSTRNALIAFDEPVVSSGFRVRGEHAALGGVAMLGVTSPLKVERANLRYTAPVGYDLETRSLVNQTSYINMAPDAREFNLELGWTKSVGAGFLSIGSAYGFNTGNVAGQQSAAGWLRFGQAF